MLLDHATEAQPTTRIYEVETIGTHLHCGGTVQFVSCATAGRWQCVRCGTAGAFVQLDWGYRT